MALHNAHVVITASIVSPDSESYESC